MRFFFIYIFYIMFHMKPDSIKIATNAIAAKAAQRATERDFACLTSENLRLSVCLMSLPSFV